MKISINISCCPQINHAFHLSVTSASVNSLCPLGTMECCFNLEGHSLELNLIFCENLSRSQILGPDLLQKYCFGLKWSDTGKGFLTQGKNTSEGTIHFCETGPHNLSQTTSSLPLRTLALMEC